MPAVARRAIARSYDEYAKELPDAWYSSNGYGNKMIMIQYLSDWHEESDERPC